MGMTLKHLSKVPLLNFVMIYDFSIQLLLLTFSSQNLLTFWFLHMCQVDSIALKKNCLRHVLKIYLD